ncbi:MAG: HlyD family efflux transporter periplasmic adaptor subunit [Sphingomonadales bacterium]|nr:HlyD family efflux transporter periplasmic adaptor subunit [Sphingomonadales bacterium]
MTRKRIAILLVVAVLVAMAVWTRGFGLAGAGGDAPLRLYGNVDVREVDLGFRVGGRIGAIAVDEGDAVHAGAVLARLDPAPIAARVAQAQAQVAAARAQLARLANGNRPQDIAEARARAAAARAALHQAGEDVARRRGLVESGAISLQLWQQTLSQRDEARAEADRTRAALALMLAGARREDIAAARAQLAGARAGRLGALTDSADTRLLAPEDATVVTRAQEPGAIVQPGETVLTLSIDRPLRLRAYVAEPDLSRVAPGMAVTVRADGNPRTYHGTLASIASVAEFTPKSVETEDLRTDLVYRARILVADPDGALRQGQPVTITVTGARPAMQR